MHPPHTLLHIAYHPPWCCLVVSFDNIERKVGVYMPLRPPRVAAEAGAWLHGEGTTGNMNTISQCLHQNKH